MEVWLWVVVVVLHGMMGCYQQASDEPFGDRKKWSYHLASGIHLLCYLYMFLEDIRDKLYKRHTPHLWYVMMMIYIITHYCAGVKFRCDVLMKCVRCPASQGLLSLHHMSFNLVNKPQTQIPNQKAGCWNNKRLVLQKMKTRTVLDSILLLFKIFLSIMILHRQSGWD